MGGDVGIELALVDDQRLVAGAVRLDEPVGERHLVVQQQRAVEELVRPAGVLHAEVLPPVVLPVAHPQPAVGILVGDAATVLVENADAGHVVGEVVGAQDSDVDPGLSLAEHALVATQGRGPQRVELRARLPGVEPLGEHRPHALVTRPLGDAFGARGAGPAVQHRLGDAGGELGGDDLVVEPVVEDVVAGGRAGLGGVLLAEQVRRTGQQPVGVDLRGELQRLGLDPVDLRSGPGQLERQAVADLGAQGHAVVVQEGRERAQHVLDVEVGQGPHVVEADLLDRDPVLLGRLVVVDGVDRHQRHGAGEERQPRGDVVAAARAELLGDRAAPEQPAGPEGRQLEGVHVHLRARVRGDLLPQLRGEHDGVPVVDDRLRAVGVEVVHRVVDRRGRGGGLAGAVHPVREQPPGAAVRRGPVERLVVHLLGQVDHGVDVEDRARLGLLAGRGRRRRRRASGSRITPRSPGRCRAAGSAVEVDPRQRAAAEWHRRRSSLTTSSSLAAAGWSASMVGRLAFDQFVPEVKLTAMFRLVVSSTTICESWTHSSAPQP